MSPLSKHICLHDKDLFVNLCPLWNKTYLKKGKNSKHSKSCLQDEACLRIKTEGPNSNYDTSLHMFECSHKYSDNNLPAPTPSHTL